MRDLQRFVSMILAFLLTLALAIPAFAAIGDTGFSDVDAGEWYADAVQYCDENGMMSGVSGTRFDPEGTLTRAQLVSVLYRMEGSPAVAGEDGFSDTEAGKWYSPAVLWASREGLVSGYGNGLFGTNDPVTQAHLRLIFQRYTDEPVTEGIPGFSGSSDSATRAQTAAILMACARTDAEQPAPAPAEGDRVLVAYFSNTGSTEAVAEHLQTILDAELYRIMPETPYTAADLDYTDDSSRANTEQRDPAARPAISGGVEDMAQYDVVFLGYPIWHGQAPKIISTFLESYDFSGKTIVPFCTSGSSPIGSSARNIQPLAPGSDWLEGRRFSGSVSRDTLESWVNGLDLPEAAQAVPANVETAEQKGEEAMLNITVNGAILTATLADNSSAEALREMLADSPITIQMSDYNNMEKVGPLGRSLPTNDVQTNTQAGDIILYQGNQIVIYYDTNSWNFTRLGKITSTSAQSLKSLLGDGDVSVTLSLG